MAAEEPQSLGERLRTLEDDLAQAKRKIEQLNARVEFSAMWRDSVLMPAILLSAGQGLRRQFEHCLRELRQDLDGAADIPEIARFYEIERVDGWLRAVAALPETLPLRYEDRHPDEFPPR